MYWLQATAVYFVVYCSCVLFGDPPFHLKVIALVYSIGFLALSLFDSEH